MSTPTQEGWSALDRGDWDEAEHRFNQELAERESASAHEGLGWVAWWRNDTTLLFRSRERAYHLYREDGDALSAARVAIWLGCDHHDFRGQRAVANGWYQRARRLLEDAPLAAEHGWLAFQLGAFALEDDDDTATARKRAAETVAVGRELGVTDLVFLGLALDGLALVTEGNVDGGMRLLDEAGIAATSGELQHRVATTWTLCYLIYACERVRDFDRAAQWCARMEEVSTRFVFDLGVGMCRAHYGGVLIYHGRWAEAEKELTEAREALLRARPPAEPESVARLGELRRRQGRLDEAVRLFDQAGNHPLARLGAASVAIDREDATRAAEILGDLLEASPATSITQRADALALMTQVQAALGRLEPAEHYAAALREIATAIGTLPLVGMAATAEGFVAVARSDDPTARRRFEEAANAFDRCGLPFEAAGAREQLARVLVRLGRHEAAAHQAAEAVRRLRELGAAAAAERIERAAEQRVGPVVGAGLSRRETEVLALLAEGLSDRQIAERLVISPHTVHRHVSNILAKLGVASRTAAATYAARHGLHARWGSSLT